MMSTRLVGLAPAFRRTVFQPGFAVRNQAVLRAAVLKRGIQTERLAPAKAEEILNAQRVLRPNSPHFTIYQPQLTWVGSIANRVTGTALSVLLYGFTISYKLVSTVPESVKYVGKALLAAPFAFHSWNGLRHLAWDSGKFLTLKGAYTSGYAVLGATAFSTAALLFV
ncbi:succinate dehydrogenase cytochrome b560 subunit [Phellopilus nigrolimitatus]|nr:succinate dehydrogenase cytochrome b560 subunit [Phellopilus nigrolimitatus]